MKNAAKLFFKISPNTMNPTYPGTGRNPRQEDYTLIIQYTIVKNTIMNKIDPGYRK